MTKLKQARDLARQEYSRGNIEAAIYKQQQIIQQQSQAGGEVLVSDYRQLAFFLIAADKTQEAVRLLLPVVQASSNNADLLSILGLLYTNLREFDTAIQYLTRALSVDPACFFAADQLTRCYLANGDLERTKYYGEYSLNVKDSIYGANNQIISLDAPAAFDGRKKKGNVIAFSLWGDKDRYVQGAIRNCELASTLYPNWQCRFYVDDSVPQSVTDLLGAQGADIRLMPTQTSPYEGLFWRFHVVSDPHISKYLIRDCDAVINVKERVAVDEWLASNKHFHIMRDYYTHTDLVMAGMWGGVTKVVDNITEMISRYCETHIQSRVMDQAFLNECMWPIMKNNCLIHDSCFETGLSRSYPDYCRLPPRRHIGQDESAYLSAKSLR